MSHSSTYSDARRLYFGSRLVQGIRESEGGSSSGLLGKAWNINVEAQEAEFRDDLREASGVGKRKGKVRAFSA